MATSSRVLLCLLALCRGSSEDADAVTSLLQHRMEVKHGSVDGSDMRYGRSTAAFLAMQTKGPHGPYDPPGAPCVNCDEHGNYRFPGRENCWVTEPEAAMVQNAVDTLAANPYDYELVDNLFSFVMMALVCTDYLEEKGGFDAIFSVLKNADNLPPSFSKNQRSWFEMNGWMALSDQSISPGGAPIIANYGGRDKGVEFMVERLKTHHQPHELVFDQAHIMRAPQLTIRYEITCNIEGILLNDKDQDWAEAAVKDGLLEELIYTMEEEKAFSCSPMWASCSALASLIGRGTERSAAYKAKAIDLRAVEITREVLEHCTPYKPHGDQLFMADMTWGQIHPADQTCSHALELLTS